MRASCFDDPDLPLSEVMTRWPQTISVFLRHDMRLCVGCPVSPFHTIADACRAYGLDQQAFVSELQGALDRA
ncbi:DUF1858 domain-containing protein [Rhodobacteraceae bacterium F11138]|nr:DUF1858 domain-containing protein [Rhodobacteraceae bacterium F11138]